MVAGDTSLHDFLESFLKSRTRWYDFPYRGARGIVAGTIVGEYELSRRVYMVLYRISSSRDPGAKAGDSLSPKDHAGLSLPIEIADKTNFGSSIYLYTTHMHKSSLPLKVS
nr:PREDICTED: uncharacterized protein LOC108195029 [Daucus carota subsp. sativus]